MLKIKSQKGQTIVEVVFALGFLAIVLGGIITLLINSVSYGASAEARSLAVNYAQEAMDVVKSIRDNEYCSFFSQPPGYYRIEKIVGTDRWRMLSSVRGAAGEVIDGMDPVVQRATNMRRTINLVTLPAAMAIPSTDGKRLIVGVTWETRGIPLQTYTTTTDLFKWKY